MSTTTPPRWAPPQVPAPPVADPRSPGRWSRLPRWAQITAGVVAAAVLVLIGASTASTKTVTKIDTARVNQAEAAATASQGKVAGLQQRVDAQQGVIAGLQGDVAAVNAEKAQLDKQQEAVAAQKAQLDQRQAAVDASTFGDGLFQVGKDIQRGQYHSAGPGPSGNCYWAKMRSADTFDIIANNNSPGPQTVTVDSPYFSTSGCGSWTKVG